jgi:hypothetical protein
MLQEEDVKDPLSRAGKTFRNRFRVPYPVFEQLLEMANEISLGDKTTDCCGKEAIPLELKVLGVLRVLGRATCFDGIDELTKTSAEVHRVFFHEFCKKFAARYFKEYVCAPQSEEAIRKATGIYERLGLPGALGSTDCVHVWWDRCPASISNKCTGKEGYPTLAWECTVDHHMKFIASTSSFYGSCNDKMICKYDKLVTDMRDKVRYADNKLTQSFD